MEWPATSHDETSLQICGPNRRERLILGSMRTATLLTYATCCKRSEMLYNRSGSGVWFTACNMVAVQSTDFGPQSAHFRT